ncbi:conjugal transfer protein TrbI [Pseudorhizobium endolithicum]|uniref:Conjugal transfer protein TrbI n=1 Tax=Pseudorhizobium endolithicum TaxID=1191678 RepID=A0ABM8PLA9_9HYPH|nr:IncP-type conjugal transfer protein TrbI [Pseudorhizobium endolithicum]CAD7036191.1 conjugal transfer protein TrbI [Pseudorhizobium endolithicum]
MVHSLQPGGSLLPADPKAMPRLNRLPIVVVIVLVILFGAIVVIGLSWRGLPFSRSDEVDLPSGRPATSFRDQLKHGVSDGIIEEPVEHQKLQPAPVPLPEQERVKERRTEGTEPDHGQGWRDLEPEDEWRARLKRDEDEQYLREVQRQRLARLQARATALDSPLTVDVSNLQSTATSADSARDGVPDPGLFDHSAAGTGSRILAAKLDENGQASKELFFNEEIREAGYLANRVKPPVSPYELKRGSVIPATLITGVNSDLPGRIIAQVSRNVYDSATGLHLLIPQGAKLFGRYDSKLSFGQERVLVVWTDLIFPNGASLQIAGMAGADQEGYGGFSDKTDRHLLQTFGTAALIALIGSGIDMSMPQGPALAMRETASDAARRNFAESFGRLAEQSISRNLNRQPTLRIRPGYQFNVLVDQDVVLPGAYGGR